MRIIIHDLEEENLSKFYFNEDDKIIDATKCKNNCTGCFSCWIKHPKKCIYNDNFSNMAEYLRQSSQLIIISNFRYGCYSHEIKSVLERCIGYVLPYFVIKNGEMHHIPRYDDKIKINIYAYGDIDELDTECVSELVSANSNNLNASEYKINYIKDLKEIKNVYIN